MKPFTSKQVRIAWIVAALFVLVHFAPHLLTSLFHKIALHRVKDVPLSQASPMPHPLADAPIPPPSVPALPLEAQQRFLGIWDGTQTLVSGNNCRVHLELRLSPYQPGFVAGYETRFCYDLGELIKLQTQPNIVAAAAAAEQAKSPVATVMTGSLFEGDLTFRVDRTINSSVISCPVDTYSVAPFGSQQVVAMWKSHGCPDGQMVLTRTRA